MPITASAGALSYAKIGSDSNLTWDYYAIAMSTYAAHDLEFYSANSYFVSATATSLGETKIVKITEEPKPKIDWSYQYNVTGYAKTLGAPSLYYDSISNLLFSTEARSVIVNTPPTIAGLNAINPITGLKNNSLAQIYKNNIGNGGGWSAPIKDSAGNFYLIAADNFGGYGVGTLIKINKLVNDGSNPTVLGYFETRGANSVEPFRASGMVVDSAGYPYVVYSTQTGTFPNIVYSTFIVKYDKTPVAGKLNPLLSVRIALGSPAGFICNSSDELLVAIDDRLFKLDTNLILIWGRYIQDVPAGSTRSGFAITVDSSNNIYCVANVYGNIDGMLLYKLNNSGTLLYSRKISLTTGSLTASNIKINNGSIYINGRNTDAGATGLVIKIPDNGTIPGSGNYPFGGGYNNALLYSVNTSSTAVVTFSPTTYAYTTVALPVTISSTDINNTVSATTLYSSSIS